MDAAEDVAFEISLEDDEMLDAIGKQTDKYTVTLLTGDQSVDCYVPKQLEGCLPNRLSYTLSSSPASKSPESMYVDEIGTVSVLRRFNSMHAHPRVGLDPEHTLRQVVSNRTRTVLSMATMTSRLPGAINNRLVRATNKDWTYTGCWETDVDYGSDVNTLMRVVYSIPQLSLFNAEAYRICKTPDSNAWSRMYDKVTTRTLHYGTFGTIYDNTIVDMRSWELSDDEDYRVTRDPNRRYASEAWLGFLDPTYTVASVDAGNIRMLVHGCRLRRCTDATRAAVSKCISVAKPSVTSGCYFHHAGTVLQIASSSVHDIAATWKSVTMGMRYEAPSLHYAKLKLDSRRISLLSITADTGCVMRPISNYVETSTTATCDPDMYGNDQHWIDSVMFASADTLQLLDITPLSTTASAEQHISTLALMMPYLFYNEPPRPVLGVNAMVQAICKPSVSGSSRVAPCNAYVPTVTTPLARTLWDCMSDHEAYRGSKRLSMPGTPLVVAFVNLVMNYEDSVILSKRVVEEGWLNSTGMIIHPVGHGQTELETGNTVNHNTAGWRCYGDYRIVAEGHSRSKMKYVVGVTGPRKPDIGDKLATLHGQKFVISAIVNDSDMITCTDVDNPSIVFKPHIVVASSSVHNRKTVGQLLEAFAVGATHDVASFKPQDITEPLDVSVTGEHHRSIKALEAYVTDRNGFPGIKATNSSTDGLDARMQPVVCNYGICQFYQLIHMTRDKQHYAEAIPKGVSLPRMRMSGSSVRLGDMETFAILAKGLNKCLGELSDTADLVEFDCCSRCMRQIILCDCGLQAGASPVEQTSEAGTMVRVITRKPVIVSDICLAVATLNMDEVSTDSPVDGCSSDSGSSAGLTVQPSRSSNTQARSYVYHV